MKKHLFVTTLSMVGLLALSTLASCGEDDNASSSSATDEIYAVYEAYKANGGTQSYDEWLASIKGEKGDKGDTGAQGEKGDKGDPGEDGQDGADGADGKDGQDGKDGTDGKDGSQIYTGSGAPSPSLGVTGDLYLDTDTGDLYTKGNSWIKAGNIKGKDGADGEDGTNGVNGKDGANGQDGKDGLNGKDGADGSDGADGEDGKSAYEIWLDAGNTGTEKDFLNSLKGSDGETGATGATGAQGEKGDAGEAGKDGTNGKDGSSVLTGEGAPSDGFGADGDSYIDTETFDYYVKSNGSWAKAGNLKGGQGEKGETGSQGIQGEKGETGATGAQGAKGEKGDKGDAGATGAQGEKGSDGKDGSSILTGEGAPSAEDGKEGDLYIDTMTGDLYMKGASSWASTGSIKGKQGVSITKTEIDDDGHLVITYSDGSKSDAGLVKDVSAHTVTFHVDDEVVDTLTVRDGEKASAPGEDKTAGYTIRSWNSKDDGGYRWLFSAYAVTSDLDLYADFEYDQYEVTFVDEKYGTSVDSVTVTYDQAYDFTKITGKTGYTHADWQDAGGVSYGFSGTWRTAHDVTLYAEWPANEYTVTLNPGGGSVSSISIKVVYESQYELPEPTKANYVFTGWYDSAGKKVSSKATWKGTEDATYTAKWSGVQNTYNFDAGDGSCSVDTMVIAYGASYMLPSPTCCVSALGSGAFLVHQFLGWYLGDQLIPQSGEWTYSSSGGTLVAKWDDVDTVSYGIYPQTRVSDEATLTSLNALADAESNGWYLLNGEYYARKSASPYSSSYVFDDGDTIVSGTEYWFKCEPITWRILSSSNGEYSLVSTVLLDAHRYNAYWSGKDSDGYYANNYKQSEIRKWLNEDFYSSAFSLDDSLIQTTTVDNSASTTGSFSNRYACDSTNDKVYLLSCRDYTNYFADSAARQCKTTDWARANGAYYDTDSSHLYNGLYWTRSPYSSYSDFAWYMSSDVGFNFSGVAYPYNSVRPSLRIRVAQ